MTRSPYLSGLSQHASLSPAVPQEVSGPKIRALPVCIGQAEFIFKVSLHSNMYKRAECVCDVCVYCVYVCIFLS